MPNTDSNEMAPFEVTVGGEKWTQGGESGKEGLARLVVEEHIDMMGQAAITIDVTDAGLSIKVGDEVEVKVGGSKTAIFKGTVTGFGHRFEAGAQQVTIRAHDDLAKLAASRETKVYEEVKDSDVASQIIKKAGAKAGTIDATTETRPYILQRNESHYTFLRRLAAGNGYLVQVTEGKIDFKKPQFSDSPTEITADKIVRMEYSANMNGLPKKVVCRGWDYNKKEMVEGTAESGDIQTIGSGGNAADDTIWGGDCHVSDVQVSSESGAKEIAKAELNRMARGYMRGRCIVEGSSEFRSGLMFEVTGIAQNFNPSGFIVGTRHIIEPGQGFRTEIQFVGNTTPT